MSKQSKEPNQGKNKKGSLKSKLLSGNWVCTCIHVCKCTRFVFESKIKMHTNKV